MTLSLFVEQVFNGLQLGMLLFLVAVGVTLVFGVMNLVNLSQGALVMSRCRRKRRRSSRRCAAGS